ncbi:type IV methyl-directed restriction system, component McrB [Campylobacter lari subsp. concheus]|uniref:McrB family protein n=1 Tax=Campylobacter lari TaxID=201 RepID=UPI002149A6B9|nr:AAA family ATPase [Campylobacter lari]EMC9373233.1 AAA family ATPase [Campylobacter lari]MCR2077205.1 AAA family ATPase [Campylobacter lari subsp. concheus]MCR2086585.1 AAA family ATPase [Campylobacter lari subsp. concheus]
MNIVEFNFSNGNKIQAQIENSNEKIFRIFLEKRLKTVNQYINTAKYAIKECKRLNIVNRDDFDIFQINSMEVLINLSFELKDGLLQEYNFKSGKGCPHACINSHYLKFVKYVNAYKNYVSKDMVKYLKTRGSEKEFKVEIKNQKIEVIASVDTVRSYSLNRFLEYSVLSKNEDKSSYAKPLFEDILSSSNLSAIKQSENERIYKEQYFENKKIPSENQNPPLNQILYGPPGTGKTYHTIDKALEILGENLVSRHEKKAKFDEYVKNGQIVFTTFHQSYGYEEFVEGIKPILNNDDNIQELKYEIKDGIFKELCKKALDNRDSIKNFNFYIDKLKEKTKEDDNNPEKYFELPNTKYSIQYRGGETFRIKFDDMSKNYRDYPVNIDNIEKLYKTSSTDEIYNSAYVKAILNYLKLQGLEDYKEKDEKTNLPYIIIIDEINRGNVSKIFGELITLIEPSKRIGESEGLKVTLPYSGEKFGVPKNVYIVGTMNTADRSITSLDTALRRRFEFVEMMPDTSKLSTDCKGVNLQELLKAINTRIEYLLDREKIIGHAFFIGVENLNNLKNVFQNKIIPLLQEYFYNDYALINVVLNENGMLEKQDINNNYLKNMTEIIESDKVIYKFSDSQKWDENTFKKIYE